MASRIVGLPVANELLDEFETVKHLIPGEEVGREEDSTDGATIIHMRMPDAPTDATRMNAWFTRHDDGRTTLRHIDYHAADGHTIT